MSVSTSHSQFSSQFTSQWFPVDSPDAWVPQSTSNTSFIYDKFSHASAFNDNNSPSEDIWFKLPPNSGCNWSDFVHIPPSAGLGAESPYSASASPTTYSPSFWDPSLSLPKEDSSDLKVDDSYSPSFPHIPRNIDIESELSRQNLYKTELCRSWVESATCKYGTKCQFAHGQHELRPVIRHPKYKTEICKTFHSNGTCPYGKRCRFVHNTAEIRPADMKSDLSEDEELRQVQERFKLANLAPDPVFTQAYPLSDVPSAAAVAIESGKKGSSLPFFQKLRKQKPF